MKTIYRTSDGTEFDDPGLAEEHEVSHLADTTTVRDLLDALDEADYGLGANEVRAHIAYCVGGGYLPRKPPEPAKVRVIVGGLNDPEWRFLHENGSSLTDENGRVFGAVSPTYANAYQIVRHPDNDSSLVARLRELGTDYAPEPKRTGKVFVSLAGIQTWRFLCSDGNSLRDDGGHICGEVEGGGSVYKIIDHPDNDPELVSKLKAEGASYA